MKYSYPLSVSYTRSSQYTSPTQYTPAQYTSTHYTPTHYTPTHYTPSHHISSLASTARYTPTTNYNSTSHYTPSSRYTPSYKSTPSTTTSYVPSYTRGSRCASTRRARAQETPAPVIPVIPPAPAKRAVHFPNDVIFQDLVRRGDMEQIGRFMRARKVRLDTMFHSGMAALHEAVLTGNLEVVKLLVRYGADVHQRDEDGWTPLHMACSDGFPLIASYLLSAGASTEAQNHSGEKPVDLIDADCTELAKLFETGCV